jgi:hypothetical protein
MNVARRLIYVVFAVLFFLPSFVLAQSIFTSTAGIWSTETQAYGTCRSVQNSLPEGNPSRWSLYQGCVLTSDPTHNVPGFFLVEILLPCDINAPGEACYDGTYFDFTNTPAKPVLDRTMRL